MERKFFYLVITAGAFALVLLIYSALPSFQSFSSISMPIVIGVLTIIVLVALGITIRQAVKQPLPLQSFTSTKISEQPMLPVRKVKALPPMHHSHRRNHGFLQSPRSSPQAMRTTDGHADGQVIADGRTVDADGQADADRRKVLQAMRQFPDASVRQIASIQGMNMGKTKVAEIMHQIKDEGQV